MSVTATVEVKLKIRVGSTWGDDCTVSQVKKQAMDSANVMLNRLLENQRSKEISIVAKAECVSVEYYE